MCWFSTARAILELLYFASGVALAVAGFLGLRQIRIGLQQLKIGLEQLNVTKEIALTNAKRESVKYAAEQCNYFAEKAVRLQTVLVEKYRQSGWTFLGVSTPANQPSFLIQNGEIVNIGFNLKALNDEYPKTGEFVVNCLNALESFAIPFASGVADEEVGYKETARSFCMGMRMFMPLIFHLRQTNVARYESAMKIYLLWNNRLAAEAIAPMVGPLGDWVKSAGADKIKPIGPNF